MKKAIEELPERTRLVYKLHRRDGLTYRELADVLDNLHKTVESQMSRSLKLLRKQLSQYIPSLPVAMIVKQFMH
ncbi:MAG: sigma factor-like helix-turn-helix DNA-binding protein [Balneolaceae bacterium]|nr:sigma factor-like helix-turn-helix DNA-binding protein [Balneolaceae bacterium]